MRVVYISSVWPEPTSSAAGTRVMEILSACSGQGWDICFCATAQRNEHSTDLERLGIRCQDIALNNSSFDQFIKGENPQLVIFDRFMLEEQFAMRVAEHCPRAMRVLDTSDLHFLRRARQLALEKNLPLDLYTDDMRRELASIYRCDLTLIISTFEYELLIKQFKVPMEILHCCPFMIDLNCWEQSTVTFEQRQHFMHIGNFLHPPNVDAVRWLKTDIWPIIRQQLPDAECHIYGAYAKESHLQMHDEANGFLIKGRCEDARACMEQYRVALAPLRFGAGIKGKIADAFMTGTPCITTAIGAEGMFEAECFVESPVEIAALSIALYQHQQAWESAQAQGYQVLSERFDLEKHAPAFLSALQAVYDRLSHHRQGNVVGALLQQQQLKAAYYMSKWIEEKSKS